MTIEDLNSDSRIEKIEFSNGYLQFYWEDYFQERIFEIRIKTDYCYVNTRMEELAYEFCKLRKFDLKDYLKIDEKSRLYLMPSDFVSQMKIARNKMNLAIGLNSTEWRHFFQVQGDGLVLACPVKNWDNVDIEEIGTLININPN